MFGNCRCRVDHTILFLRSSASELMGGRHRMLRWCQTHEQFLLLTLYTSGLIYADQGHWVIVWQVFFHLPREQGVRDTCVQRMPKENVKH